MEGYGGKIRFDSRCYYLFKWNDGILKIVDHYVASTHPGDIKFYKIEDNKILLKTESYAVDDKKIELTF